MTLGVFFWVIAVWFLLILLVAPLAGRALRLLGEDYPPVPFDWERE